MTLVIQSKEKYLTCERFVRDMDIVMHIEATSYIHLATPFRCEEDAKEYIKLAEASGYDTSDYIIIDKDKKLADEQAAKENAELEAKRTKWQKLSVDDKRAYLSRIKSEDDLKQFLADMQETVATTPMSKEELANRKIARLESDLGITFTAEQKQILLEKEINHV